MSTERKASTVDSGKQQDTRNMPAKAPGPLLDAQVPEPVNRGGRPRIFQEPTVRLNLFIPEATAKRIRHLAIESGVSPSQLVDDWAQRAELDMAIARGRKAVEDGLTVDQAEAERRLSRWF